MNDHDPVNHPKHYVSHPSGIECIQVTEHMSFCLGNAVKYVWRADHKNALEDIKKARWYVERAIKQNGKECVPPLDGFKAVREFQIHESSDFIAQMVGYLWHADFLAGSSRRIRLDKALHMINREIERREAEVA